MLRGLSLKRYLPKSLFGRSLLIIVLPIALMQIAVTWVFFEAHWQTVTSRLSDGVAGDIAVAMDLYNQQPGMERLEQISPFISRTMSISVVLEEGATLPLTTNDAIFRAIDRNVRRAFSAKLDQPFWFDTTRYRSYVDVRVLVDEGVLRFVVPRDRVYATTGHIFIIWIVVATVLLTAVSLVYIRNQAKPIERLAKAAEAFGRGQDMPDFRPTGASEARLAAQSFIQMRARIRRHLEQRAVLLAGVSHDLRTPLTRMRLQLALLEESEEVAALRQDISDMEEVVEEYLAFARGVAAEASERITVSALLERAIDAADLSTIPDVMLGDDVDEVEVRPVSMRRCLINLLRNAEDHAETVQLRAETSARQLRIHIDDDGPGIPVERREEAFTPFTQLNAQGSRNADGVGLGLAIARDVARAHGGDVVLGESPLGGLRVTVRLPV
jgi:two-component system osmolarity sensor histidine kinase EnvZ